MFKQKILRKFIMFFTIIISFLIETSFTKIFSLTAFCPNLLIMLTVFMGFIRGRRAGIYTGFFSGLLIDAASGNVLGFQALIFLLIGYFCGIFRRVYYDEDIRLPLILVVSADFIYNFIYYIFFFFVRNRMHFGYYFINNILPEMIFTCIIALLTYRLVQKIDKKLDVIEKGSESVLD